MIPPLRDRKEDIEHLANRFLHATNAELNKNLPGFSDAGLQVLLNNDWPGNVRQLRSMVRSAVLRADDWITPSHLILGDAATEDRTSHSDNAEFNINGSSLKELVRRKTVEVERQALTEALKKTGGNKAKAARLLQIDYTTMHAKLKQYAIKIDAEQKDT